MTPRPPEPIEQRAFGRKGCPSAFFASAALVASALALSSGSRLLSERATSFRDRSLQKRSGGAAAKLDELNRCCFRDDASSTTE